MTVTVFPKLYETSNFVYGDVHKVLDDIRTGGSLRGMIEEIRELMLIDEAKADELKKKLPGVCFGGKFSKRMNSALLEASGLMILDFDKVDMMFAEKLAEDPFIWAYWISPRGNGLKALVKIPVVANDAEYKRYFHSFQQRYPDLDPSGKDVARICYFSFDPGIVIKDDAQLWDQTVEIKSATMANPVKQNTKIKSDFKKIAIGAKILQTAQVGNRHDAIIRAGRLMGGYIATGEIDESDVMNIFEKEIQSIMDRPEDFRTQWKTFVDGVTYGKADPIKTINETKVEEKIGKIDFTLHDVRDRLVKRFKEGRPKGYHVGWDDLRHHYQVLLGYTTYIYGTPYSGKSQWLFEALINLAEFYDMKHAVLSPESGSADEVFEELIQIYAKKDFTNAFNNQMTEAEREAAEKFIDAHFIIIDPEELDVDLDVKDLLDYVDILERQYNTKIHTLTIDPWNELDHEEENAARDRYLEKQLKLIRRNAKKNNRHIFVITHTKEQKQVTNKDGDSFYPIATPSDIAGGPTWYRKGYMMLSFWRPTTYRSKDETIQVFKRTLRRNSTIIQIQKSKPKGVGAIGEVEIYYDAKRHRYYESGNQYAHKIEDVAVDVIQKEFVSTNVFDEIPF